jgi:hypothetical protein
MWNHRRLEHVLKQYNGSYYFLDRLELLLVEASTLLFRTRTVLGYYSLLAPDRARCVRETPARRELLIINNNSTSFVNLCAREI